MFASAFESPFSVRWAWVAGIACLSLLGSCANKGAEGTDGGTGSGGAASGGRDGGSPGTGGAATGGAAPTSTGGSSATGGVSATGGSSASGGRPGSGGAATGGVSGSGGVAGSGGAASGGAPGSGGATGTGGRGGAGSGGSGAGGAVTGSGGSGNGSAGATGQLTPQQVVKLMSPGWNLGNSFDATPDVTSWGNPLPAQSFIKAVHDAGFKTLRLPVTWADHLGAAPSYTINASWMSEVTQTAQWAIDAGMFVFINIHHDADGSGSWVTFPASTSDAQAVAAEVTAVWTQIATAFKSFDSKLMLECFNEPNEAGGGNTAQAQTDLNMYLEACVNAIRGTGGANATRIVMIQPVGASPIQAGIQSMQKVSIINDPNLLISLHTYYPTNFGLSETPYAWGSSSDYTAMQTSITQQIRVWLPTQPIVIGEWGSMEAQTTSNRAAHALAYAQDVTTAGMVPVWWDNGGSGSGSFDLFNRSSGAQTFPTIVSAIMTGVKNGQAAPNTWATLANP